MIKHRSFMKQMDRLVYSLASNKFDMQIAVTERFIGEQTCYSEASVRAMRSGSIYPDDVPTMEVILRIGAYEAGMEREWALKLLKESKIPHKQNLIDRYFPLKRMHALIFFSLRWISTLAFSIFFLWVWSYFLHPAYPAAHNLPFFTELLWGMLLGTGLAAGLGLADFLQTSDKTLFKTQRGWLRYTVLTGGGAFSAVLWQLLTHYLSQTGWTGGILSRAIETLCFGATYSLGIGLPIVWIYKKLFSPKKQRAAQVVAMLLTGLMAMAAYLLAAGSQAFAGPKEVDLFVGIFIRIGLVSGMSVMFPPLENPRFQPLPILAYLPWGDQEANGREKLSTSETFVSFFDFLRLK